MNSNTTMIKKLKNAINSRGEKLLYNTTEFYSEQQDRTVTIHIIKKQLEPEPGEKKGQKIELFSSTSTIQIVLFLRDYWYELNGWEVPKDNQVWNEAKDKYKKKQANKSAKAKKEKTSGRSNKKKKKKKREQE